MKKSKKCKESGICPECGSNDLYFGASEPEGESIFYEFTCNKCGIEGREYYNLTYSETWYG